MILAHPASSGRSWGALTGWQLPSGKIWQWWAFYSRGSKTSNQSKLSWNLATSTRQWQVICWCCAFKKKHKTYIFANTCRILTNFFPPKSYRAIEFESAVQFSICLHIISSSHLSKQIFFKILKNLQIMGRFVHETHNNLQIRASWTRVVEKWQQIWQWSPFK